MYGKDDVPDIGKRASASAGRKTSFSRIWHIADEYVREISSRPDKRYYYVLPIRERMKVIIVGAGNVGMASAEAASRNNDVLMIDSDPARTEAAKNTLPVSVLREDGSNPKVLREAIERTEADIIFSSVPDDAINIFICVAAKNIKPTIRTIACIRNPDYMVEDLKDVDLLISPESITAEKIIMMTTLENAVTFDRLSIDGMCIVTFRIENGQKVVGKTVMEMDVPKGCSVVAVYRGTETLLDTATAELRSGDRLCVMGTYGGIREFNDAIGVRKNAREVVILGAGQSGIEIGKTLCADRGKYFVKIIDDDLARCREASKVLREAIVVNGPVVDPVFLRSENVDRADVVISVSPADERNLLACMTALRFGIRKIISRYSMEEYDEIFKYAGIESVVGYHRVIVNEISRRMVISIDGSSAGFIRMDRPGDCLFGVDIKRGIPVCGMMLGNIRFPEGVRVAAVIRDGDLFYPSLTSQFAEGDRVLIYAHEADPVKLSALLGNQIPEL